MDFFQSSKRIAGQSRSGQRKRQSRSNCISGRDGSKPPQNKMQRFTATGWGRNPTPDKRCLDQAPIVSTKATRDKARTPSRGSAKNSNRKSDRTELRFPVFPFQRSKCPKKLQKTVQEHFYSYYIVEFQHFNRFTFAKSEPKWHFLRRRKKNVKPQCTDNEFIAFLIKILNSNNNG